MDFGSRRESCPRNTSIFPIDTAPCYHALCAKRFVRASRMTATEILLSGQFSVSIRIDYDRKRDPLVRTILFCVSGKRAIETLDLNVAYDG